MAAIIDENDSAVIQRDEANAAVSRQPRLRQVRALGRPLGPGPGLARLKNVDFTTRAVGAAQPGRQAQMTKACSDRNWPEAERGKALPR